MKEKLIIIIKLSLRKKANRLQKGKLITNLGNKNNSSKKRKKKWKETTHGFIFITSLSYGGLAGWAKATVKDARPLPLRSSLIGIGRVSKTISMLWEASFSLEGSLGAAGGWTASWATSLVISASFSATSGYSASLERLLTKGRALAGLSLPASTSFGGSVSLGARRAWSTDGRRAIHTLCFPKGKGSLNLSLVEGIVPHLEVVVPAHLRDLSPKGLLSLCHSHFISILLSLILGLLGLLQFLLELLFGL